VTPVPASPLPAQRTYRLSANNITSATVHVRPVQRVDDPWLPRCTLLRRAGPSRRCWLAMDHAAAASAFVGRASQRLPRAASVNLCGGHRLIGPRTMPPRAVYTLCHSSRILAPSSRISVPYLARRQFRVITAAANTADPPCSRDCDCLPRPP